MYRVIMQFRGSMKLFQIDVHARGMIHAITEAQETLLSNYEYYRKQKSLPKGECIDLQVQKLG